MALQNVVITCWIHVFSSQLIQSPVTTPLGLIMLKTTSEELACPREDLSVARKEELRKLLLDQVQTVLGLLTGTSYCTGSIETNVLLRHPWDAGELHIPGSGEQHVGDVVAAPAVWKLKSTLRHLGQFTVKQTSVAKQLYSCVCPLFRRRDWDCGSALGNFFGLPKRRQCSLSKH